MGSNPVVQAKIAVNVPAYGAIAVSTLAEAPVQQCDPPVVEEAQLTSYLHLNNAKIAVLGPCLYPCNMLGGEAKQASSTTYSCIRLRHPETFSSLGRNQTSQSSG
jgi:hypothetical protein